MKKREKSTLYIRFFNSENNLHYNPFLNYHRIQMQASEFRSQNVYKGIAIKKISCTKSELSPLSDKKYSKLY